MATDKTRLTELATAVGLVWEPSQPWPQGLEHLDVPGIDAARWHPAVLPATEVGSSQRDLLLRALENARFAPSGGNRQGWRVVVVEDPVGRAGLRDLYLPHWRAYTEQTGAAQMLADPESFDPARVRMVKRADEYAEGLAEVPLHLVVGCASRISP